jgi:excinuclease UvrABC nuclease subunit
MGMCLRPCQSAVSESEYASEVGRVAEFLSSRGRGALQSAEAARDRLSAEMQFEAAAQQHKRIERIQALLKLRDDLVSDIDSMQGIAVVPSTAPGTVMLWMLSSGFWQAPVLLEVTGDHAESMDSRLQKIIEGRIEQKLTPKERSEHIAILARWFYSSWRDGIWVDLETRTRLPYRKLVSAISRTVHQSSPTASH